MGDNPAPQVKAMCEHAQEHVDHFKFEENGNTDVFRMVLDKEYRQQEAKPYALYTLQDEPGHAMAVIQFCDERSVCPEKVHITWRQGTTLEQAQEFVLKIQDEIMASDLAWAQAFAVEGDTK